MDSHFNKNLLSCFRVGNKGAWMAANLVNLDALIQRDDFFVEPGAEKDADRPDTLRINDFERSFFYLSLRKPDFQRETANWDPEKIVDFVRTFIEGDLIPAVIFWSNGENNFVIDGAHRLSALIAWVHDDYGDKEISRKFFQNYIPPEQERAAQRTRALINKAIGPYSEIKSAPEHEAVSRPEALRLAKRLGSAVIKVQWVQTRDASKAEASFFKINQGGTQIDPTEIRILKSRNSANALAARVIVRNATGHRYWSKFDSDTQKQMEDLGREIYSLLYTPPLQTPIKTLDIPIAGRGYSGQSLPLVLDLVNLANDIKVIDATKKKKASDDSFPIDEDGKITIQQLTNTRRIVRRLTGVHPSSLGLHPAVYFYSLNGRHQPTAVMALFSMFKEIERSPKKLKAFIDARADFEKFLVANKGHVNAVVIKRGSGAKGFNLLAEYFESVLAAVQVGKKANEEIFDQIISNPNLEFLEASSHVASGRNAKFSGETKSEAFLDKALGSALKCSICGGYLHRNSITIDHIERRQDGGTADADNADLAHPYCNTTYKG